MQVPFALGFIAGEGTFTVGIGKRPSMSQGVQFKPAIQASADKKDREIIEELQETFGGSIYSRNRTTNLAPTETVTWKITGFENCREFISTVEGAVEETVFTKTEKYESYSRFKDFIETYNYPQTREEAKELVVDAKNINDSTAGGGKTAEEWFEDLWSE
jgi:hypothetical protein